MSEHLTKEQLEHYADRSLAPAELLDVDDHLSGCPECREKAMGSTAASAAGIRNVLKPTVDNELDHPDHELIEGYVDGTLGAVDKEIVDGHLDFCRSCAEEVAELRSFRDVLSRGPEKVYAPAVGAGMFQRMDASTTATRRPVYRFAPAFAMAAAVLIAAVVVFNNGRHAAPRPAGPQMADNTPAASSSTVVAPLTSVPTPAPAPAPPAPVPPLPAGNTTPSMSRTKIAPPPSGGSLSTESHTTRHEAPAALSMTTHIAAAHAENGSAPMGSVRKPTSSPAPGGTLLHPNDMMAMSAPTPKSAAGSVNGPVAAATDMNGAAPMAPAPIAAERTAANTSKLPDSVKQAMSTGHIDLDTPEIRELTGAGSVDMDSVGAEQASFTVTSPVSTAVLSDRPAFSWGASKDASAYQVSVTDASGGEVEDSPVMSKTSWKAAKPLPRGELLKWQVKAMENGEVVETSPGAGARFRVVDADRAAQIEDAQKTFADQPTALGILYAQAGMFDEAERELSKASKDDPGNEVVTKLLSDVRSVRQEP